MREKGPRRRHLAGSGIAAAGLVAGVALSACGGGASADIVAKPYAVVPLNGSTIRIYMTFTNKGKAAGTSNGCAMDTNVYNQLGDEVNTEVNSTAPNHGLKPGQSIRQYQDIGVNAGDANYIKVKDVTIKDC